MQTFFDYWSECAEFAQAVVKEYGREGEKRVETDTQLLNEANDYLDLWFFESFWFEPLESRRNYLVIHFTSVSYSDTGPYLYLEGKALVTKKRDEISLSYLEKSWFKNKRRVKAPKDAVEEWEPLLDEQIVKCVMTPTDMSGPKIRRDRYGDLDLDWDTSRGLIWEDEDEDEDE
jgi:hypothetical protein